MNILRLCLIAALITGSCCKTIVDTPVTSEQSEKSSSSINEIIHKNDTTKIEEKNSFESVEKFVANLLGPLDKIEAPESEEGRTFGVKRLQFMLMPMMYKMGVIMTMLTVLTVISLKGLAIGVILLVLKLSAFFGKFYAHAQPHIPYHGWSAEPQPVHVHVHNNGGAGHHHHQPYNGWESVSGPADDEHYYYKG